MKNLLIKKVLKKNKKQPLVGYKKNGVGVFLANPDLHSFFKFNHLFPPKKGPAYFYLTKLHLSGELGDEGRAHLEELHRVVAGY